MLGMFDEFQKDINRMTFGEEVRIGKKSFFLLKPLNGNYFIGIESDGKGNIPPYAQSEIMEVEEA